MTDFAKLTSRVKDPEVNFVATKLDIVKYKELRVHLETSQLFRHQFRNFLTGFV
jgi:hypothetical protein